VTSVHPALALAVFVVLVTVLALVVWPRWGIWPRVAHLLRLTERARIEDALKHLHDCEYHGSSCTLESLAGGLETSRTRAVALVARLNALGLVRSDGQRLKLTAPGRMEALRVLRSHRLWERYLADRTGVAPSEWHDLAEEQEHVLSEDQVEKLASSMGHPVYDPHGDPIPTVTGELPPPAGAPVTALRPGQTGNVVHLEDEPKGVYERLLAAGLVPGTQVRLERVAADEVRLVADGVLHVLEPVVCANITVLPLGRGEEPAGPFETLAALRLGERGVVVELAPALAGPQRRRLLDLGFVPGTEVRAELQGALSGAVAFRVRDTLIALRPEQADMVRVERAPAEIADE
jgi:DtxR family Mn-dependent transcriptional regulator